MRFSTINWTRGALTATLLLGAGALGAEAGRATDLGSASVIKIHVTSQREHYAMPWQGGPPSSGSGTGFIIRGRRLLTNAHLVADARFIEVQKDGDARRYRATVAFAAHDCDLAMLTVDDPAFFEDTRPMALARRLPRLNDGVIVLGYPLGGNRLSVTKGVVSRIDYVAYAHSGVDHHLALQVDAAINPGNSGGPVTFNGRVVGLAFQGLSWADNIGYAIPLPVIERFLADVADGHYDGYPELGVRFLSLRNPAMRRTLAVPPNRSGVVVTFVDAFGAAHERLRDGDVILAVDGHQLDDDGTIQIDGQAYLFAELLERKQRHDTLKVDVWRDGAERRLTVPLDHADDPFTFRNLYDHRSPYVIVGGLVFAPLTQDFLRTVPRGLASATAQRLFYTADYVKTDGLYADRQEFVVLIERLPHPVNTYVGDFQYGLVAAANNRPVRNLAELHTAMQTPIEGFHQLNFIGMEDPLVLDAEAVQAAEAEILQRYRVPSPVFLGATP